LEELFWVLVVVAVLLIPVAGVVGAIVSIGLRRRVGALESRIAGQPALTSTLAARVAAL
jgi:predicted anti-sigma-YlaC factor YlaD